MFEQITKSYRSEVRTYTTDKLMFGCKEKLKLHLLNKYKKEKKEKRNLIETLHTIVARLTIRRRCEKTSYVEAK